MNNLTISIFGNQIFSEIINELKLFSKYKVKLYNDLNLCIKEANNTNQLTIFYISKANQKNYEKLNKIEFPLIIISESSIIQNKLFGKFIERLNKPIRILDLEKKIISLLSKFKFKKSSLINLLNYTIDKNERIIKKNNLKLKLTEKEIYFLILFSEKKKPLSRDYILKKVWNYSPESDTHTVETHIHRLRKKIFEKFNDKDFIKNNDKGYYI